MTVKNHGVQGYINGCKCSICSSTMRRYRQKRYMRAKYSQLHNDVAPSGKAWYPAQPSPQLIKKVHEEMQPDGVPCECKWCREAVS